MSIPLFDHPLKVTLVGLDERAQARMEMFLRGPAHGVCLLAGEADAEAAIVDLDGFDGERVWQAFRGRFQGPALILSVAEKSFPDAIWVRKPLNTEDFLAAIEAIQQRPPAARRLPDSLPDIGAAAEARMSADTLIASSPGLESAPVTIPVEERRMAARHARGAGLGQARAGSDSASRAAGLVMDEQQIHEYCGGLDDVIYLDPARRSEIFYAPDNYLQGAMQQARQLAEKQASPVRLDVMGHTCFYLPKSRKVLLDMRENILRPLCVMPRQRQSERLRIVTQHEVPTMVSGDYRRDSRLYGFDNLLWLITLWTSRGRVPKGTDLDAPISLLNWPNFTRLLITPHAMQIAAVWHTQPASLMQTAKRLALPYRQVFAFYSACQSLGLLDMAPAPGQNPAGSAVPLAESSAVLAKRGMLGSLLRKLRLTN